MRVIFHIGMGKTGTSSIQKVLRSNPEALKAQKAEYLGMWFDIVSPEYRSYQGLADFMRSDPATQEKNASKFAKLLKQKNADTGIETFIFSNEAIFGHVHNMTPFLQALKGMVNVQLVAYMRDPHQWLPSAYTQWTLRHKQKPGPLEPFPQRARELIGVYEGMRIWIERFNDILTVRKHDTSVDAVADFCETAGLELDAGSKRYLERSEPAETLMRAMYNARFQPAILPERFNRTVLNAQKEVPSVKDMTELCFVYDEIPEIVQEKRELFEFIRDQIGFDFLEDTSRGSRKPDPAELQARLVDYLIEISFSQAERIRKLEQSLAELSKSEGQAAN